MFAHTNGNYSFVIKLLSFTVNSEKGKGFLRINMRKQSYEPQNWQGIFTDIETKKRVLKN